MPKIGIDFSAIAVEEIVFVTPKGKRYTLNDDVSWGIIFQAGQIRTALTRMQERATDETMTADEAQALIDDWCDEVVEVALPLFRNTPAYAHLTKDELLADFEVLRLLQIIDFFTSHLGKKSSPLPDDTGKAPPPLNRHQKRSAVAQKPH